MTRQSLLSLCILASFPVYGAETPDPEALFAQAMQSRGDGELYDAIELFETILQSNPGLNRARLELAVAYHKLRRFEEAKKLLTRVLNDAETPETVKLSITAYLAQLESDIKSSEQRSSSTIYLSAGLMSDSNINLGPDNIRNFSTLDPAAEQQSGSAAQLMLSYAHRSRASQPLRIGQHPADFEWLSQLTLYDRTYSSGDSDFNLVVYGLNTGPALISENNWRAAFNIKVERLFFGNNPFSNQLTINPVYALFLSSELDITLENITTRKDHSQANDSGLDGTMTTWHMGLSKFFPRQVIGLQAGVKYHDNGAKLASLHYNGLEYYLGGQMPAWHNARTYLTLSSRNYAYDAVDGVVSTTTKRDETEVTARLGLSHDFREGLMQSWTLNTQYTYIKNDSNLDAYSYDRNLFELNLRRYFF